ncbi:MAG: HTH domain-containing protein [Chlorobium phaeovibrioides]|nr:HTH domain-containing protein [Chlorobium phaeovibrioides]
MAIYSFLDLAADVLKVASQPLTYQEVWQAGKDMELVGKIKTAGKTPWQSLGAQLYVEVRDNDGSRFMKVGKRPARFFLKARESDLSQDAVAKIEKEDSKKKEKKTEYHERDLHPLLTYFAYANPTFNRGRSIFTKTIFHEKSQRSGYNEWIHPDIVGFYLPLDDWRPDVIEFNRLSDNNSLRLFSFEMKKSLNKGNYREAYFQAVSNSSWAHEGYLVAADILQEDEFLAELERLASSFGIGIIHLDPSDIDSSSVLYPARGRGALDWETINKLCDLNGDFEKFLQDVKIDFESKRIHRSEFDEVIKDIQKYVQEKLKIGWSLNISAVSL